MSRVVEKRSRIVEILDAVLMVLMNEDGLELAGGLFLVFSLRLCSAESVGRRS